MYVCMYVCMYVWQAPYGYDQRAEVLGLKGMIATDNMYPNTARIYTKVCMYVVSHV